LTYNIYIITTIYFPGLFYLSTTAQAIKKIMADSKEIIRKLAGHSRNRKWDKKKQQKSLLRLCETMEKLFRFTSKSQSKVGECTHIYNYCKKIKSNCRDFNKLTHLDGSEYDKFKDTITTESEAGNNVSWQNNLKYDGFKHNAVMNILVRDEDENRTDNECCPNEVMDQEKVALEDDKSKVLQHDAISINVRKFFASNSQLVLEDNGDNRTIEHSSDCTKDVVDNKDTVEYDGKLVGEKKKDLNKKKLMQILLSQRHFKIKITDTTVFMEIKSMWHPRAVDDIPWSWLNEERWRLHTYSRYPHRANKSAMLLAEDGFIYLGSGKGNDDKVICHFCLLIRQNWQASEIISVVHKELSPECSLVTGVNCNNVRMTAPKCGLSLFEKLNNPTDARSEVAGIMAGHEVNGNGIEDDSAHVSIQHTGPNRPNLPGQASGNAAKPIQMASQTIMRKQTSSASSLRPSTSRPIEPLSMQTSAGASDINTTSSSHSAVVSNTTRVTNTTRTTEEYNVRSTETTPAATDTRITSVTRQSTPQNTQQTVPATTGSSHSNGVGGSSLQNPSTTATNNATSSSMSQNTNPPQGQGVPSQTATCDGQNPPRAAGRGPTYLELGIITERPKRFEFAVRAKRLESFDHWPRDHHMKKEDLADSGFYYAGYGDCARCFYCGGGLRNWEDNDNVCVEHARWFPKCAFVRQTMGQQFVDAVQDLNRGHDQITFDMVTQKIGATAASLQLDTKNMPLKRDPAVITVLDMGFIEKDVLEAANFVKESNGILSADKLFEKLQLDGKQRSLKAVAADSQSIRSTTDLSRDEMVMNQLKEQNNQLRQQTVCKICMDKEVAVLFLPCGHLVSCTDCAAALKDCPVCRNSVRGIVRAFMA
jgi:baculoviral IAP repeat-containing protein 7/8